MFKEFIEWRQENDIDNCDKYEFPELEALRAVYPAGHHNIDKFGRPIYIEVIGPLDPKKVFSITTEERLLKFYHTSYESLMNFVFPACSAEAGRHIEQGLNIFDLKGGKTFPTKQMLNLMKVAAKVTQDYYPEILGAMYLVNANFLFRGVWAVVKGFLDEKTRKKVTILGKDYEATLLGLVDAQNLPAFLGGDCDCSATTGNCMTSGIGPWKDYELVKPKVVRKK